MTDIDTLLRTKLNSGSAQLIETVQSLWSGYGAIERWQLDYRTVIVKRISPPNDVDHPRGWSSDLSHQRKLRSYQVEQLWYQQVASSLPDNVIIPQLLFAVRDGDLQLLVLEDLAAQGFDCALANPSLEQIGLCVQWLARFHAHFMGDVPQGVWQQGGYWHLDTRPEEWAVMNNLELQAAANAIDAHIQSATYKTLVHGDAKLANFCGSSDAVAALDFQYVGAGIGVRDLAYFLGSLFADDELAMQQPRWIDRYFEALAQALALKGIDSAPVEAEWRALYDFEVADFARFLDGWAPDHWKINDSLTSSVTCVLGWYRQHYANVVSLQSRKGDE
ncbi:phosphotransferase [Ferrimonas lipolytica]|uniref:Phosphotransferase n=1 Tax=Ferrimonas lipolytica TaxID=2724191 RepID=A0A6H1UFI8_9GAMM|nr:phosphotransferase [Ferrimonas lipolytica]QIZ77867.1 phosphotransferase [Ferrimonas lipolytica]